MKSRLSKFLLLILLIVGAFELFVRVNADIFFALSDKLLLKVEILERNPDTKILCLGTSRFLDAIDERQFSAEIERLTDQKVKVMNAATTGSQGARFEYFAEIAAKNKTLSHVILEATPPALQDGELNFPDHGATKSQLEMSNASFAAQVEKHLQTWVTDNVAIAKFRKSLRPATLKRFFVLQTSNWIAPNNWSRKGIARNLFLSSEVEITEQMVAAMRPKIVERSTLKLPIRKPRSDVAHDYLMRVSEIFSSSNIEIIWVSPPVASEKIHSNHNGTYSDFYRDIVLQYDAVFYDYAANAIDGAYLRDSTHLNPDGRFVFTAILARDLAERMTAHPK
jgi:hypothetical protein